MNTTVLASGATRVAGRALDDRVAERAEFLAGHEPFKGLSRPDLERVAAALHERAVVAGEMVLVESGPPGTELYVSGKERSSSPQTGSCRRPHVRRGIRPPDAAHRLPPELSTRQQTRRST